MVRKIYSSYSLNYNYCWYYQSYYVYKIPMCLLHVKSHGFYVSFSRCEWKALLQTDLFHYKFKISNFDVYHCFTMIENEKINATIHPLTIKLSNLPMRIIFHLLKIQNSRILIYVTFRKSKEVLKTFTRTSLGEGKLLSEGGIN